MWSATDRNFVCFRREKKYFLFFIFCDRPDISGWQLPEILFSSPMETECFLRIDVFIFTIRKYRVASWRDVELPSQIYCVCVSAMVTNLCFVRVTMAAAAYSNSLTHRQAINTFMYSLLLHVNHLRGHSKITSLLNPNCSVNRQRLAPSPIHYSMILLWLEVLGTREKVVIEQMN